MDEQEAPQMGVSNKYGLYRPWSISRKDPGEGIRCGRDGCA